MSLSANFNNLSPRRRTNLRGMLVVALLIPGCAGKRIDLLTSQVDESSAESIDAEAESALETGASGSSGEERPLVARSHRTGPLGRLTTFARRRDGSTSEDRPVAWLRSIWSDDGPDEAGITSDPFVQEKNSPELQPSASNHLVRSESSTAKKLLANLNRESSQQNSPEAEKWWEQDSAKERPSMESRADVEQTFADEFDSRLDQLRAELASAPEPAADKQNPFAKLNDSLAKLDDSKLKDGEGLIADSEASRTGASTPQFGSEAESAPESVANANPPRTDLFTMPRSESQRVANERLQGLMADALSARENGDLERAYRIALEAQALAVLENVRFTPGQRRPERLAELIKAELQGASPAKMAGNQLPVIQGNTNRGDESIFLPIDFPALGPIVGDWESNVEEPVIVPDKRRADLSLSKQGSGVNLFPPGDDFPSEAEMFEWEDAQDSIADTHAREQKQASEEIHLTIHRGSEDLQDSAGERIGDQLPGFTEQDNHDLISSVSEQRNRVFELSKIKWPSQPPLTVDDIPADTDQQPIRVAQAPQIDLDVQTTAPAADAGASTRAAPVESGSIIGQIWRSQPIWLVGGLVLLVIALRLLPWPREKSN